MTEEDTRHDSRALAAWRSELRQVLRAFPGEIQAQTIAVALGYLCGSGYDAFGTGKNLSANEILERAVAWAEALQ